MSSASSASAIRRARQQVARIGDELTLARATHGMTRQQASVRAGVSWSTVARAESGDPQISVALLSAVAEAVGLDLVLRAYPGRSPSLRDSGQLKLAELLCGQTNGAWQSTIELAIGAHGEAIDVVLFGPREIVAVEIERMATDFQAQFRRADAKRRQLADQHRRPVRLLLVVEDTRRNRRALEGHLRFLATALPARSREVLRALRTGADLGRDGLLWLRRVADAPSR